MAFEEYYIPQLVQFLKVKIDIIKEKFIYLFYLKVKWLLCHSLCVWDENMILLDKSYTYFQKSALCLKTERADKKPEIIPQMESKECENHESRYIY